MLTVRIKTDNEAFHPRPGVELARLLRKVAHELETDHREGNLFDVNGNRVGEYKLTGRFGQEE
jgi:hypothetical protein